MDVVSQWSERIAHRFTPAEASFAAEVGMAYAAGGDSRKDLLPRYGTQPGAFGPGGSAAELPMLLQALADAGPALRAMLASPYLSNALAAASLLAALRQGRHREPAAEPPAQVGEPVPAPPRNEKQAVEFALATLTGRLADAGFDQVRAGELAYGLLAELVSDAAGAALFVDALTAMPDDQRPRRRRRILGRRKDAR